jgi:hypothetical protein
MPVPPPVIHATFPVSVPAVKVLTGASTGASRRKLFTSIERTPVPATEPAKGFLALSTRNDSNVAHHHVAHRPGESQHRHRGAHTWVAQARYSSSS